jgi:hypothetical protein
MITSPAPREGSSHYPAKIHLQCCENLPPNGIDQVKLISSDRLHQADFANDCVTSAFDGAIARAVAAIASQNYGHAPRDNR